MIEGLTVGSLVDPLSGRRWNPAAIRQQLVWRIAYYQRLGMKRDDAVFFHYGNTMEFFVDLLAVWGLGGCAIPIDARLTPFEIETLAQTAQPRFSLWDGSPDVNVSGPLARKGITVVESPRDNSVEMSPTLDLQSIASSMALDQNALILFTSGTTGQPKGVVHSHRSLQARWMSLRMCLGLKKFQRTLCLLPTHFGHGLICNCLFPWLTGQDLYILPPFKPELLMQLGRLIDEHKITFMSSVPAMWRLALKTARPPQLRSLERVFCGSAPLSGSLWTSIQEWTGTKRSSIPTVLRKREAGWPGPRFPILFLKTVSWVKPGWHDQDLEERQYRHTSRVCRRMRAGRIRAYLGQYARSHERLSRQGGPHEPSCLTRLVLDGRHRFFG